MTRSRTQDTIEAARRFARDVVDAGEEQLEDLIRYLDSPEGRRVRAVLAGALIATAPLLSRMRWARMTPAGRVLRLLGGTAAIVKAAHLIRDWEPGPRWATVPNPDAIPPNVAPRRG